MARERKIELADTRFVVLFTLLYAGIAMLSLELAQRSDGIAFVWPASGVAIASMLMLSRRRHPAMLLGVGMAGWAANAAYGTDFLLAAAFAAANVAECFIAERLARRADRNYLNFTSPRWAFVFGGGVCVAGLCSASIATLAILPDGGWPAFFVSWLTTVVLGALIVTPLMVELTRSVFGGRRALTATPRTKVAVMAFVLAISGGSFFQDTAPLLFLPLGSVIIATYVLGVRGAVGSVFIVALTGSVATALGYGSVNFGQSDTQAVIVFFQFYLLATLLCALPMAALLERLSQAHAQLKQSKEFLETAEATANVGHWYFAPGESHVFWSDEVYRIHGRPVGSGTMPVADAVGAYHPADMPRVRISLDLAIRTGEPFLFEARIVRPDGTVRHVQSRGQTEVENGETVALFGVIIDITDKTEALEEAKSQAAHSRRLAETDQLTGIANRRKLMEVLSGEIETCKSGACALTFVLFDIDNFKAINDTHGHGVGDEVLKRVAAIATDAVRGSDLVGRLGGEEFGIVLPGSGMEVAQAVAERVRRNLNAVPLEMLGGRRISASLGIVAWHAGADETALLQAADAALYEAKRAGKNCIRLAA
ncbi:diguanylate cyclase [Qipengyuania sp. JC766]|uniref:sensor domain-containing diguanylate cyclase n=1 Tax=Qipengyuania sp. JC766 TaxID=3232139 RepID=UPI0034577BCE